MNDNLRRIGVLTSGGDAPGMNAAIRAVVRTCVSNGIKPVGVYRGFNGLIHSDVIEMDARSVNGITKKGGTVLYTARCPEFKEKEYQQQAVNNCKYLGLGGLVILGGDGSFKGAEALSRHGINTIAIPATIDNDIGCTEYSIGFDTAANTAVEVIDRLDDTMQSHERCSIVEVMGHGAGHLALYTGLSVGATAILVPEKKFDFEHDVAEAIRESAFRGKHHHMIVVSEGVANTMELKDKIVEELGIDTRITILGHVQRGGSPSAQDRVMATRMGHMAVEALLQGQTSQVVCYRDSQLILTPIADALKMKRTLDPHMFKVSREVIV